MPAATRNETIAAVLALLADEPAGRKGEIGFESEPLRRLTADPVYAIPTDLLHLLGRRLPGRLRPEELELERRFTSRCTAFAAVGILHGRFVRHPFFCRPGLRRVTDETMTSLGWDIVSTRAALEQAQASLQNVADNVVPRREAFVGWLITHPPFVAERDALRLRWRAVVDQLGGIPPSPVRRTLEAGGLWPADAGSDAAVMAGELDAFYERWDLLALSTWDLPLPTIGNFGCVAAIGNLTGVEDSPTVQLPRTLRLPVRLSLDGLLRSRADDHLAEWRAVEDLRATGSLNYVRLRRVFQLHFLRNVVLSGAYSDRFRRRVGKLDSVFADYFGSTDEESVRKDRLWIERRLKPACTTVPGKR